MRTVIIATAIGATILSTSAFAQGYPYNRASSNRALPFQVQDQRDFQASGTRGRMGLGADAYHPEGPGNVVTPHVR